MLLNWDLWAAQPTIADRAVEWLREQTQSDQPFFLYVPLLGPHTPIVPSAEFRGRSDAGPYGDWVAQMDSILGRVVDVLEESGKIDDTVVIFTSDNGSPARSGIGTIGQTNTVTELYSHVPNAPWRGLKADAWEAGHRVPFIVRWDGRVEAGATNDATICLTDVYASIAEIVGAKVPRDAAEDSFSLLPLLLPGAPGSYQRNEVIHSSANGTFAIRKSGYKLILSDGSGGFSSPRGERTDPDGDGPTQLYLLSDDPQERRNLADSRQAKARELRAELNRIRAAGRSRP
jgi:arylsulfatase A